MPISLLSGALAALAAALIGSSWQLLTRHGVTTTLGPIEIALLRYGIPALVLLPVLWRSLSRMHAVSRTRLAVIVAGGGLPVGLLVFSGARLAPASHMGVFMAGTMPVFTALACRMFMGEAIAPTRWFGFGLILAGVSCLGLASVGLDADTWRGDALFVLAAAAWAAYTVAFRGAGLAAIEGAAVINAASLLGLLLMLPWAGAAHLATAPWHDIVVQGVGQGLVVGLFGLATYMFAVTRLGSSRAALSSALVPPMTALGAAWILGEPAGGATWIASVAVACGIALALWDRRRPKLNQVQQ